MEELFDSFEKSIQRLEEVLKQEKTIFNRDSSIQRFEFTIELAWKCIQKFLREQRIVCRSPKECLKEAFKFDLIDDDNRWLKAFDDRNLTVHTYKEEIAEKIYNNLPDYLEIFKKLKEALKHQKNL
ncbi:nucleotidyltransferase substrate binding protein [Patescibacteria group bacterium]|nr:nucleotidyltransferase substrate binding protein [Patescibacteria group bacterium]